MTRPPCGAGPACAVGYTRGRDSTPGAAARRGWFITIEGPDGAGKTTQAQRLAAHLEARGRGRRTSTREPGGTWLGERLRELLLARTGSTAAIGPADRRVPVQRRPPPARRRGHRARRSTPARPSSAPATPTRRSPTRGTAPASRSTAPRARGRVATDGLVPDLTILLDLPVEVGLARKAPGDVTRFEAEFDLDFHRRVRDGFLALRRGRAGPVRGHRRRRGRRTRWPRAIAVAVDRMLARR